MAEARLFNLSGVVGVFRIASHVVRMCPWSAYQGPGTIAGTVSRDGVPGSYRVYLLDRENAHLVDRAISASDGSYSFHNLKVVTDGYLLVSVDNDPKADALNAAVSDLITPSVPAP